MRRIPVGTVLTQLTLLLAAIGWLAGGATAWAERITGTFRYADFNPAAFSTTNRPIQFCKVEIHSFRPRPPLGWIWGLETTTTTDAAGSISVTMPFRGSGVAYDLKVFAQNYAAVVLPSDLFASGPFWQEPGFPDGAPIWRYVNFETDTLDFSYNFTDALTPKHWSLADAVRHGFDYVVARRDPGETDPLPPVAVHPGDVSGQWGYSGQRSRYNSRNQTLEIDYDQVWQDFIVLQEYAHFVEHQIGTFAPPPGSPFPFSSYYTHDGCTAEEDLFHPANIIINSPEHAWMEGFAQYFAQVVAAKNPPGTFGGSQGGSPGTTSTVPNLENTPWTTCTNLPANITPNMIENVVAGVLWDVFDAEGACGSSEAHDGLAGFDTAVIQILDRELDNMARGPSIGDFSAAWFARGLPGGLPPEPFADILVHHGLSAPLAPPSLLCPGGITVSASATCGQAAVPFPTPALSRARRCAVVVCDPPSGSTFPIGTTTVNCRAEENGVVFSSCSFTVTVQSIPSFPNPNGTGLLGVYYDNSDFTAPRVARTEAVNFDWGLNAPVPGVDVDTFSVRWTGKVVPRYSDTYRFLTVSDDGARLWIDGRLIVNAWFDQGPTEHSGDIILEAGQAYDVVLEMYENGGGATAKLLWESGCQLKEPIPASHLLPAPLECPTPDRSAFSGNFVNGLPAGTAMFGQAAVEAGWLKLTRPDNAFGILYIDNFSGAQPVHGFEAKFTAALFGSTCCGGGALPADGFSFNLVPAASVRANPGYGQPGEEGLDEGFAVNFDTYDNGGNEGPAVEVKWRGQVIARQPFQASQSPLGITTAREAAQELLINLTSDGLLSVSYGVIPVLDRVQTPYTPLVIGTPKWVIGARNGGANDNHWIRNLQIVVNRATIPGMFNTGVDNLGHVRPDDASELHYAMRIGGGPAAVPFVARASGGFPIGPWLADNLASAWIAPSENTLADPDVDITYETTFNLQGLNPASAVIHGWIAADNQVVRIRLNGQSTGQGTPFGGEPFTTWQAFAITSGLQPGANTLTFETRNGTGGSNPTGLRVQMCGWATPPSHLRLSIVSAPLRTTLWWGSLPHKEYFLEHADKLSGPWVREPGLRPGTYEAQFSEEYRHVPRDPVRFYHVIEAP